MENIIQVEYLDVKENKEYIDLLEKVAKECFKQEGIKTSQFYISITLTNNENIRKINNEYRKIDKETDVLSFPMFEKEDLDKIIKQETEYQDVLGDVIISLETVEKQRVEYGHSFERELAYMLVHSFYHLMGYDHIDENDKKKMREKEEIVLKNLDIQR